MEASPTSRITTDYLVVGAGFSGLSFVDELLTRTSASIVVIDRRDAPGGHWNDSYPYVKLHGPSTMYGVESRELSDLRIEPRGVNEGLQTLATGAQIVSYSRALMEERFLASGRVTFLPSTTYEDDGTVKNIFSGEKVDIEVKNRVVDARYYANVIPRLHTPSFSVAQGVTSVPPNDLPRLATYFDNYVVLGGGKTGVDAAVWLVTRGIPAERIFWIIPNDYWYTNRAIVQNDARSFENTFNSFCARAEAISQATDMRDMGLRFEKAGVWHRLDPKFEATEFHAAIVSDGEMKELRKIHNVIRKGYVQKIELDQIHLTKGTVPTPSNALFIDCTACALPSVTPVPIYQPGKIILQLVRTPHITLSCAMTAFIESLPLDDAQRNEMMTPLPFTRKITDYIKELYQDSVNRSRVAKNPEVRAWLDNSRLEGFAKFMADRIMTGDKEALAIGLRIKEANKAAAINLERLYNKSHGGPRAQL